MPLYLGCGKKGTELAPRILRGDGNELTRIFDRHTVCDQGDIAIPTTTEKETIGHMKHIVPIRLATSVLADRVYDILLSQDQLPLILGGDHSLSWGSIAASAKCYPDLGVCYIDAHGDFNTPEMSDSHNVHGMHMSFLMGFGYPKYVDHCYSEQKISPQKVFFYGTRNLDPYEKKISRESKLNILTTEEIHSAGRAIQGIIETQLSELQHIHLSIDIDVLDPSIAPGTGVPEKNGLTMDELQTILIPIVCSKKIVAIDFVEYNPLLDKTGKTHDAACKILSLLNEML